MADQMISREPIKNQVADILREAILTGRYKPGDHVVTKDIAYRLQIGRGVIREALMQLETEGLIVNRPYKGSFVANVCRTQLKEICDLRVMIEVHSIRELDGKLTDADRFALYSICARMEENLKASHYMDMVRTDSEFHGYFVKKISENVLYEAWNLTSPRLATLFFSMISKGYPIEAIGDNHRELLEALFRSTEEYVEALKKHYRKVVDFMPED